MSIDPRRELAFKEGLAACRTLVSRRVIMTAPRSNANTTRVRWRTIGSRTGRHPEATTVRFASVDAVCNYRSLLRNASTDEFAHPTNPLLKELPHNPATWLVVFVPAQFLAQIPQTQALTSLSVLSV